MKNDQKPGNLDLYNIIRTLKMVYFRMSGLTYKYLQNNLN
jgi:hypothetical protein